MHGETVVNGVIRYLSVSQMNTAESCLRKWHFEKVGKIKADSTEATALGSVMHAQIEEYLKTGNRKVLGPIANAGFHLIPLPGDDLLIEKDMLTRLYETIEVTEKNSQLLLDNAILHAGGVPVLGFIDLINPRGTNKGGSEIEDTIDPPGTIEVLDWKSTSDFKWTKKGKNLIHTAQMSGYGKWILNQKPEVTHIRLSHAYFLTKGMPKARKETALFTAEQIHKAWEHWEGVARLMVEAAKQTVSNKVQENLDACNDYGGCHLLPRKGGPCSAGMDVGVAAVLGITQARKFAEKQQGNIIPMGSLLSKVNKKSVPVSVPEVSTESLADAKDRLKADELAGKLKARIPDGFVSTWEAIKALQVGTPKLTGKAAQALMATLGADVAASHVLEGVGPFAKGGDYDHLSFEDPELLPDLLAELTAAGEEEDVSPLPPDAPESDPALAYKEAAVEEGVTVTEEIPPPKKESAVAKVVAAAGPKEKKAREPKRDTLVEIAPVHEPVPVPETDGKILLFIDCIPSIPFVDLYVWCNHLSDEIANQFPSVDKNGNKIDTIDIRSAGNDTALGFGKWEGVLSAIARSEDHSPLKGGTYYIDTRSSKIRSVVADSLKERAVASGGFYVRGGV